MLQMSHRSRTDVSSALSPSVQLKTDTSVESSLYNLKNVRTNKTVMLYSINETG